MGASKSGLTRHGREAFLRNHGFVFLRHGKGDHDVWEHPELKALARSRHVDCPANLLPNTAQAPWEHTVPKDPAVGTWLRLVKHAEWCEETVAVARGAATEEARRRQTRQDFLDAKKEICDWKHETRHRLRAGLDANPAPDSYHKIKALQAKL